jgi:hypothetical protein
MQRLPLIKKKLAHPAQACPIRHQTGVSQGAADWVAGAPIDSGNAKAF